MGFMSAYDGTHRVVIPHPDKEYWVDLKNHLTHGATEKSTAALQQLTMVDGKPCPAPDVFKSQAELVLASVVAWNFDDDNGTVWPINMQNLRRLPDSVFTLLHRAVEVSNAPDGPQERLRFPDEGPVGDSHGLGGAAFPVDVPAGAAAVAAPWPEA